MPYWVQHGLAIVWLATAHSSPVSTGMARTHHGHHAGMKVQHMSCVVMLCYYRTLPHNRWQNLLCPDERNTSDDDIHITMVGVWRQNASEMKNHHHHTMTIHDDHHPASPSPSLIITITIRPGFPTGWSSHHSHRCRCFRVAAAGK